jgi:hypothetical protein
MVVVEALKLKSCAEELRKHELSVPIRSIQTLSFLQFFFSGLYRWLVTIAICYFLYD